MNRILLFMLIFLLIPFTLPAQYQSNLVPGVSNQAAFMGGLGYSRIDGEDYLTLSLRPELAFGKFGVGFDIPFRYNMDTGEIREADWNESYDYFRVVRYVRYGHKRDKFYTRVGVLDGARIGHGFIMNFYNNEMINYDGRKIGLELDVDAGNFGFETSTSNLGRAEIFGGRAYYRPLYNSTIPVIRNFAIGASYVTDIDPDSRRDTDDGVSVFGADVELPIIKTSLFQTLLYYDWAKIKDYGDGTAVGVELSLRGLMSTFSFTAQLERRFLNDEFIPNYFDAFYELDRFMVQDSIEIRKTDRVQMAKKTNGTFGLLHGSILNTLEIVGTFERLDNRKNSGIMHLEALVPNTVPKISMHAAYDRVGIDDFSDAFQLDNRSIARAGIGYKIYPFLVFYMDYVWTYRFDAGQDKYVTQKRFEPQIAFVMPFQFTRN
ncbi:MAG: hypothetical protein DWQ05_08245 [Calditrichaeota bacterium]|nr:MAG: hypothetical protein DWQ05_08245 [Calditrichota bacterium]